MGSAKGLFAFNVLCWWCQVTTAERRGGWLQVYKTHLVEGRAPAGPAVDSARANLAATFVNAFVNAGFGTDKLVTPEPVCQHVLCPLEGVSAHSQ